MTKRSAFSKLEDKMVKKFPNLWILGLHIFLPVVLTANAVLFTIGYFYKYDLSQPWYELGDFFGGVTLLMTLLSILLFTLFIIRQVRFNTHRIHHRLPYKQGISFFIGFFLIFSAISALPVMANLGSYVHSKQITKDWNVDHYQDISPHRYDQQSTDMERFAEMVYHKEKMFYPVKWEFWNWYLLISVGFAMMLFAICATKARDFGWAMFISALFPIMYFIIYAFLELIIRFNGVKEQESAIILLTSFLLISIVMALGSKPIRSRAFSIAIYLYTPALFIFYMLYFDWWEFVDSSIAIFVVACVATVFFNVIFRRKYVEPH